MARTLRARPGRARDVLGHAARHADELAVVAGAVGGRRLAHELGEARAERPQRRAADLQADLRDREVAAPQQRLRALDAPRHQVRVGRLAVRRAELAGEVRARHQRLAGEGRHVERTRVLAVHQVACAAQMREVGELLGRHRREPSGASHVRRPTARATRFQAPVCREERATELEGVHIVKALRNRLSFANVVSLLALFVALGGTTYAAASLPSDSVGSLQIRTDGVGKSEIRSGAVGRSEVSTSGVAKSEIATGAVGKSEVTTNAVGASEIAKDAVGTSELRDGTVDLADLSTATKAALTPLRAAVTKGGALAAGNATSAAHPSAGVYTVTFGRDVSTCQFSATLAAVKTGATVDTPDPARIVAQPGTAASQVQVRTFFGAEDATTHVPPAVDEPFHLVVAC